MAEVPDSATRENARGPASAEADGVRVRQHGLREQTEASCRRRRYRAVTIAKRLGKPLGRNTRAAGLFETDVAKGPDGRSQPVRRQDGNDRQGREVVRADESTCADRPA